jgi:pimeloyl-ACP methyl ester carboxylesterase
MGQSWGGYPAVSAALQHPRLFAAVVALEPFLVSDIKVALEDSKLGFASATALSMARRRDVWASRQEARKSLLRNPYYAAFDSDVFERVMQFDLMPTGRGEEVTLVTPKAMEVVTMMRLKDSEKGKRWSDFTGNADQQLSRISYRAEVGVIKSRLPEVRPPVLYVFGTKSIVGKHGYPEWLLKHTGTGEMGSGGVEKDMVNLVWIKGAGHPMPFEKPRETAEAMVPWIKKQIRRWAEESETENAQFYVTKISPFWAERLEKLEKLEKL